MVQAPKNATFHNNKDTHSVVLLAVCDAHYRLIHSYPSCTVLNLVVSNYDRFLLIDIGDAGRHSDGGILANSEFGNALEIGSLSIPELCPLPGTTQPSLPFVIVGDEAFH